MRTLKICFVTQEYPQETGWGGIGTYTHEMAKGLVRKGHRVIVLSRAIGQPSDQIVDDIRVVRILPKGGFNNIPFVWRLNKLWEGYRLAVALTLPKLIREEKIDIVEVPSIHGEIVLNSVLRNLGVPYVCRFHSCTWISYQWDSFPNNFAFKKCIWSEKIVAKRAQLLSAPSQHIAEEARAHFTIHNKETHVIPNPLDCRTFCPTEDQESEEYGVLFLGKLVEYKGAHLLPSIIQGVLKKQKDVRFTILGNVDDEFMSSKLSGKDWILSQLPANLHSHIRFFRWVPHAAVLEYYRGCRMVILPSLIESFGYSAIEAMACGKPVVAHAVGGLNEILRDEHVGTRVPVSKPEAFVDAIVGLWRDPQRCVRIGRDARQRVLREYDTPRIVDRMLRLYRSQLGT